MTKEKNIFTPFHKKTKRNYVGRMMDRKIHCMDKARKFEKDYWDGPRRYGYGGYKFIEGLITPIAKKIIKDYKLDNKSRILDAGCGKGYVLYELKRILPGLTISGFDISNHGLKNSKEEIKAYLFKHDIKEKFPFKKDEFDLVISLACLHNLQIQDLEKSIAEIDRVGKKSYIMVEGYRNNEELFNLQCWALTAETFFHDKEWEWLFKKCNYSGDYELIYFE